MATTDFVTSDGGMSTRLQGSRLTHNERVLALLADGQPHTHHELYRLGVIAHSRVSALRGKGYQIDQWREHDDYMYRLVSSPLETTPGHPLPAGVVSSGADNTSTDHPSFCADRGDEAVCAAQLSLADVFGGVA